MSKFYGEQGVLELLRCDDFPVMTVLEEFIDREQTNCINKGLPRIGEIFYNVTLQGKLEKELERMYPSKIPSDKPKVIIVDGVLLTPIFFSSHAVTLDPSIQYCFYINFKDRKLHGI